MTYVEWVRGSKNLFSVAELLCLLSLVPWDHFNLGLCKFNGHLSQLTIECLLEEGTR